MRESKTRDGGVSRVTDHASFEAAAARDTICAMNVVSRLLRYLTFALSIPGLVEPYPIPLLTSPPKYEGYG